VRRAGARATTTAIRRSLIVVELRHLRLLLNSVVLNVEILELTGEQLMNEREDFLANDRNLAWDCDIVRWVGGDRAHESGRKRRTLANC